MRKLTFCLALVLVSACDKLLTGPRAKVIEECKLIQQDTIWYQDKVVGYFKVYQMTGYCKVPEGAVK